MQCDPCDEDASLHPRQVAVAEEATPVPGRRRSVRHLKSVESSVPAALQAHDADLATEHHWLDAARTVSRVYRMDGSDVGTAPTKPSTLTPEQEDARDDVVAAGWRLGPFLMQLGSVSDTWTHVAVTRVSASVHESLQCMAGAAEVDPSLRASVAAIVAAVAGLFAAHAVRCRVGVASSEPVWIRARQRVLVAQRMLRAAIGQHQSEPVAVRIVERAAGLVTQRAERESAPSHEGDGREGARHAVQQGVRQMAGLWAGNDAAGRRFDRLARQCLGVTREPDAGGSASPLSEAALLSHLFTAALRCACAAPVTHARDHLAGVVQELHCVLVARCVKAPWAPIMRRLVDAAKQWVSQCPGEEHGDIIRHLQQLRQCLLRTESDSTDSIAQLLDTIVPPSDPALRRWRAKAWCAHALQRLDPMKHFPLITRVLLCVADPSKEAEEVEALWLEYHDQHHHQPLHQHHQHHHHHHHRPHHHHHRHHHCKPHQHAHHHHHKVVVDSKPSRQGRSNASTHRRCQCKHDA